MITEIQETLDKIYDLVDQDRTDDALDVLFDEIDTLFEDDSIDRIDDYLVLSEIEKLNPVLIIGFLSITLVGRHMLKFRNDFADRASKQLVKLGRSIEDTEELLKGLI